MENRFEDLGFECRERSDPDGARRLTLLGEVDIAVADELARRLGRLERARARTRLDLSELQFIDLCGLELSVTPSCGHRARTDCEVPKWSESGSTGCARR